MSVVSNLFGFSDHPPSADLVCRPARRDELYSGLKIALGSDGRNAPDGDVLDFLRSAIPRRIDTAALWVAESASRLAWAILPIVSPGRTMLLLCPGGSRRTPAAAAPLIAAVCEHYRQRGIHLAQVLADPAALPMAESLRTLGFGQVAELLYMQRPLRQDHRPQPSTRLELHPYRPEIDPLFRETILATYEQSLDCPALNGLRSIDDIMAGHHATGEFDPNLWTLLVHSGKPVGVTLLSCQRFAETVELVYFGLVPAARGRGLGNAAMRAVLQQAAQTGMARLSLAVDTANAPAIRLYSRHGLSPVGRKMAFLRDLRHTLQSA